MERSEIHVKFHPQESLPAVGETREARGLAHWNYKVLRILKVNDPDKNGYRMVDMYVERWIVE